MEHVTELMSLGLSDKEAGVYLSCLELGPSPAQIIAKKAGLVRATTYVILEALMNMGLVTKYKEGKKTMFSAEAPRQLLRLLEKQEESIKERQHELELLLPELQMLTKAVGGKPSVRYFEGKEGLRAMRQEIVMYSRSGDTLYNFTPTDHLRGVFAHEEDTFTQQRITKGIGAKTLFTTQSKEIKEEWLTLKSYRNSDSRFVPPEKFPVSAGMTIYRDRIAIGSFTGQLFGVVVESQQMVNMMRALFNLAWERAETLDFSKQ